MILPHISSKNEVEEIFAHIFSLKLPDCTMKYYKDKFETKEAWCMAYKKDLPCLRIGTTSRIEGINAIIKTELNASSRLVELFLRMLQIHDHILNKRYADGGKVSELLLENLKDNILLLTVKERVSPFVFEQISLTILKSFQLSVKLYKGKYTVQEKDDFKLEIDKNDRTCSCKYYKTMGIPCCHLVSIFIKNKDYDIMDFIRERWILDLDSSQYLDGNLIQFVKEFLLREDQKQPEEENKSDQEDKIDQEEEKKEDLKAQEEENEHILLGQLNSNFGKCFNKFFN